MRVVKLREFKGTCSSCYSELAFTSEDIRKLDCGVKYVICPVCKNPIMVDDPGVID